jgi:hypothetical protein
MQTGTVIIFILSFILGAQLQEIGLSFRKEMPKMNFRQLYTPNMAGR